MQKAVRIPETHPIRNAADGAVGFFRKNTVMCIAAVLAAVTVFIVPPDSRYAGYVDYKTLACLFCTSCPGCSGRPGYITLTTDFCFLSHSAILTAFS